jgi:hypothetical protein
MGPVLDESILRNEAGRELNPESRWDGHPFETEYGSSNHIDV